MYQGIKTSPFQYAVHEVAPPYAPEAWERPAAVPGVFTQVPSNLPGPIFPAPGWHYGPSVHAEGYGAADTGWSGLGTGTKVGLIAAGVLALGALGLGIAAFRKPKAKTRANPRYKKYPFYVIRKSDGVVYAGFDLREDATYALRHPGEYDYRETKADSAVMTHDGVKRKYGKIEWLKANPAPRKNSSAKTRLLARAPDEVKTVGKLLYENAKKEYGDKADSYVYISKKDGEWRLGDNVDNGLGAAMVYTSDGQWVYRRMSWTDRPVMRDTAYKSFESAKSDAKIWYTG